MAQRISTVPGVAQVQVYGSQKYAVRVQLDPRAARQPRHRHRRGRRRRAQRPTSTCRPGRSTGRAPVVHRRGQRPAHRRRRPTGPLIVAYRNGAPGAPPATSAGVDRQRRERQDRRPGTTSERAITLAISSSPAPTRSQVVDGGPQAPADVPEAAAGVGDAPRPVRPLDADPRVGRRREVHAAPDARRSSSW